MPYIDVAIAVITATGGLGLAAMSLVDALKALPGGAVAGIGFHHVETATRPYAAVLSQALGDGWLAVLRAHWINGRSRDEQMAVIRALLRLGLTDDTAPILAAAVQVEAAPLKATAGRLASGRALSQQDITLIGRVEVVVQARLEAAFDRADQAYRNQARVLAGAIALGLSVFAWWALNAADLADPRLAGEGGMGVAVLIGILAVPIAPIAKDLVSALTASTQAVKAAKRP